MKHFCTLVCAAALMPTLTFAVGDEDETPPAPTETSTECTDGQIYDEVTKACVEASDKQTFNDDHRYRAIRELAYAGEYDRALMILASAENANDPRFLNYTGFIHRKQGSTNLAMTYYQAALAQDPNYILARSYMGLGLLAGGDLTGAKAQLREIRQRGGRETWAYKSLSAAILKLGSVSY